ncbi:MAG TPA: hypothetical protein VE130_14505 [Nitrososphaeraceae archaeon]|nr:hypothetical protein [Nitrososphaeraceae archaeon]
MTSTPNTETETEEEEALPPLTQPLTPLGEKKFYVFTEVIPNAQQCSLFKPA